jgi:hypothetical protein
VELATIAEALTGTDTARAVTPAGVQAAKISQGAPTTIASAATVDIGAANTVAIEITGATTISSFGTNYNGPRFIRFTAGGTLTHNATTLNLPGLANMTRFAGDTCIAYPNAALTGWNVVQYQRAAQFPPTVQPALSGVNSDITSLAGLTSPVAEVRQIQPIGASVAANALAITASALSLEFRSTTLTSGAVNFVEGTPANLVIPSTATLGTVNAVQSRIVVLALNNAGTIELAAVNIAGGNDLSETGLINTTAIAGGSNSASTIYSTTARTGVPYRVIGYVESTQATAGTWAAAPSTVQGYGGQALAAMSSLGYGQTWQSPARSLNTTYYNTTGKPIIVKVYISITSGTAATLQVNGVNISADVTLPNSGANLDATIPSGSNYGITAIGAPVVQWWRELR